MKNQKIVWALGAVALVAVVAIIVLLVYNVKNDSSDITAAPEQTITSTAPSTDYRSYDDLPEGAELPVPAGAMVGNTQRYWPDQTRTFDDSGFREPGTYGVDVPWGRPVWVPINHEGDLPDGGQARDDMSACGDPSHIDIGSVQQQYVNGRFLVVGGDGPFRMDRSVPHGYAHTPAGAVLAAINQMGYGLWAQGDGVGEEIDKQLWSTSQMVQEERAETRLPRTPEDQQWMRPLPIMGPYGFGIVTCTPNVMVVQVFHKGIEDPYGNREDMLAEVPLFWRDGDWVADFSGAADKKMDQSGSNIDENQFQALEYH